MTSLTPGTLIRQSLLTRFHFRQTATESHAPSERDLQEKSDFGPERRREARYATYDAVEVAVLRADGFQIRGVLRDVSRNGLRVEVGLPVEQGTHLKITLRDRAIIFAVACYCRESTNSYHVGACISEVYRPKGACFMAGSAPLLHTDFWPAVEAGKVRECRDLAKAIVDEHVFVVVAPMARPQGRLPPVSDMPY
jgi:hypothetical protein